MKVQIFALTLICLLCFTACGPSKVELAEIAAKAEKAKLAAEAAEKKQQEENRKQQEENRKQQELAKAMAVVVKGKKVSEWQLALADRDEKTVFEALEAALLLDPKELVFLSAELQPIAEKVSFNLKTRILASNLLAVAGKSSYENVALVFHYVLNQSRGLEISMAFVAGERVLMDKAIKAQQFDRAQQLNESSTEKALKAVEKKYAFLEELRGYKFSSHVEALGEPKYKEYYKRYCEEKKLAEAAVKDREGGFFADFLTKSYSNK